MRKRMLMMMFAAMLLVGCAKKDLTPQPIETSPQDPIIEETTSKEPEPTEATQDTVSEDKMVIPDKYEIYKDGESHFVMYHTDGENALFSNFTNVSRPDLGIQSVSFLSELAAPENGVITISTDESIYVTNENKGNVYEIISADETVKDDYHHYCYMAGTIGIFSDKNRLSNDFTAEEANDWLAAEHSLGSDRNLYVMKDGTGNEVYVKICGFSALDDMSKTFYGFVIFDIIDDEICGVYCTYDMEMEDSIKYIDYTLQSLEFTK